MRIPSSANTAPFNGCMSANIGHRSAASSSTDASPVNARGSTPGEHEHERGEHAAERDGEPDHPLARAVGLLPPAGAELAPDDDLPRDRDRVEHEREEDPELERDLVRGDRGVAEAGRDRAGEDEREHERSRADEDPLAERQDAPRERRRTGPRPARAGGERRRRTPRPFRAARRPFPTPSPRSPSRSRRRRATSSTTFSTLPAMRTTSGVRRSATPRR